MDILEDFRLRDVQSAFSHMSSVHSALTSANAMITNLVQRVSSTSPSLGSIAMLLIILFLSLKLLGMLYRAVMFWVFLAVRIAFFGSLALAAMWMYTRGPEGAMEDIQYWSGYWTGEYHRWERQAQRASGYGAAAKKSGFWG
ncbi:hypothetical protein BT63DRAFT_403583 [Microthyrium microscopicum]|uniref:Uncharacterized protein n=1 Tax=Microthyrium microscopicum TaxID=703497 RepID=A0A6A6U6Y6_9PEZI|nr:hypothetical protein BT63DRAFT_403583 [Microthyrium microscopicum]